MSELNDAATALVAVDAITPDRAREVLADYAAAEAARDANGRFLIGQLSARATDDHADAAAGAADCGAGDELELAGWHVRLRYIALEAERVDISAVYTVQADASPARRPHGRGGLPNPLSAPVVADDRGTRSTLDFRGGGSDDRWHGMLTADQPLAVETTWIELFGRRIELVDRPVEFTVEIEPMEPSDPAHRHLWRHVALAGRHFSQGALGPAIAALTASGTLAGDDPAIELAHRVNQRVPTAFRHHGPTGSARNLPEPWRSLLRRAGRADGPHGLIVVGAVTP